MESQDCLTTITKTLFCCRIQSSVRHNTVQDLIYINVGSGLESVGALFWNFPFGRHRPENVFNWQIIFWEFSEEENFFPFKNFFHLNVNAEIIIIAFQKDLFCSVPSRLERKVAVCSNELSVYWIFDGWSERFLKYTQYESNNIFHTINVIVLISRIITEFLWKTTFFGGDNKHILIQMLARAYV